MDTAQEVVNTNNAQVYWDSDVSQNYDIIYYLAMFSPVIKTGEILWNRIVYGKNKIVLMAFYRKLPEELQEMNAHVLTKLVLCN